MTVDRRDPQPVRVLRVPSPRAPRSTLPEATRAVRELTEGSAVEDAVNGAFAVLAVAGALARTAGDRAARQWGAHVTPRSSALRRSRGQGLRGTVSRLLAHPVSTAAGMLAAAADELVPGLTRAVLARLDVPALVREFVDVDRLAAMLDVEAVVARVDLDAIVARVDIDAVLDRVDLDAIVARVDIDAVLDRVDLDAVVDRVDIGRILDRVDVDAIVAGVDLDAAVRRVDLDAAVARVDLDRAVDRVDVDRVIARTDIAGLARYVVDVIDLPGLLRASTSSVTTEMVRSVRDQGADADRVVERMVDRLLHRPGRRTGPAGDGTGSGGENRT